MSDRHSNSTAQFLNVIDAPPDITGRHFYHSDHVPDVYGHIRVLVDQVAGAVGRLISCDDRVPEQDDHVPDCVGHVSESVDGVISCVGNVCESVADIWRCDDYVPKCATDVLDATTTSKRRSSQ